MKGILVIIIAIVISLSTHGQKKNIIFQGCDIGDSILNIKRRLYCLNDYKKIVDGDLSKCESNEYRYFLTKNDSALFNFIVFENAIITKTESNVVRKIWLFKMYGNEMPATIKSFERDFENLKKYLDTELGMAGVRTNENIEIEGYSNGFKWVTNQLTYSIKTKANKLSNAMSVEIY